jgi:hypothetical protein
MPALTPPPNDLPMTDDSGRPTRAWAPWFAQLRATLVPKRAFYIPVSDGAPTFTPETRAGFVAMAYDTANNRIYVFNGSWKLVALT